MCLLYVYVIRQCSNLYPFCALTYTRTCLVQCTPGVSTLTLLSVALVCRCIVCVCVRSILCICTLTCVRRVLEMAPKQRWADFSFILISKEEREMDIERECAALSE